ncbi:MAG: Spx/MgsR family RNA polymerase-binding regulatory protein [Synechococcaceae cyanobacterium]
MKLYSYPRCGTCRKAVAWLDAHHLAVQTIDITEQPPSREELSLALQQLGRKRLFNTSGQSYRALGGATVQAMDDDQALAALAADGKLIRRPFLITAHGRVLTGFRPEEWQQQLLG